MSSNSNSQHVEFKDEEDQDISRPSHPEEPDSSTHLKSIKNFFPTSSFSSSNKPFSQKKKALFAVSLVVIILLSYAGFSLKGDQKGGKRYDDSNFNTKIDIPSIHLFTVQNQQALTNVSKDLVIPKADLIPKLSVYAQVYDNNHLSIQIRDANKKRYEIPYEDPYPHPRNRVPPVDVHDNSSPFSIEINHKTLEMKVRRKATKEVIFEVCDKVVYTDRYLEFTFKTPTKTRYGLGQKLAQTGNVNIFLYGHGQHPMYLMKEKSNNYHVFLLRNMSPGEVKVRNDEENTFTWQVIGGILDFNFFLGTDPESALEIYHNYVGGWPLPALWSLGYHQNRWAGYPDIKVVEDVMVKFKENNIPLEALWTDSDYQKELINFTIDEFRYPLREIQELYTKYGKRWIILMHAFFHQRGLDTEDPEKVANLLLYDSREEICKGHFLLQPTVFIDFQNPECGPFWKRKMRNLWQKWSFSGVWLDANHVANQEDKRTQKHNEKKFYDLPYWPGGRNFFEMEVINPDCRHHDGTYEIDVRAWNSLFQAKYTFDQMLNFGYSDRTPLDHTPKKFPFVVSPGFPMGIGQYAVHVIQDAWSNWESLRYSFSSMLNDGILGAAMTGADICGFFGDRQTERALCVRWHQAAMFYPFARNSHTRFGDSNQEPYTYSGDYGKWIVKAIKYRYAMMKYLYTQFFLRKRPQSPVSPIHRVGPVLKPLFLVFPNDPNLPKYTDQHHEEQAMFGDHLMIAPALYEWISNLGIYFPTGIRWYDLRFEEEVPKTRTGYRTVTAELWESCPMFLRGGSIFYTQETNNVLSSEDLDNNFKVVAGLDHFDPPAGDTRVASSKGHIMAISDYDETNVYDACIKDHCLLAMSIEFTENIQHPSLKFSGYTKRPNKEITFTELKIMGVSKDFSSGNYRISAMSNLIHSKLIDFKFEKSALIIRFDKVSLPMNEEYFFKFTRN